MQTRISSIFGSYDLFAKAFPGTVFLLGFISLLPSGAFNLGFSESGALVAATIVLVLVLGFVFGQALHSMAVQVENRFYSIIKTYYILIVVLRQLVRYFKLRILELIHERLLTISGFMGGNVEARVKEWGEKGEEHDESQDVENLTPIRVFLAFLPLIIGISLALVYGVIYSAVLGFLTGVVTSIVAPVERLKAWGRQVLRPHRFLFEERIEGDVQNELNDDITDSFLKETSDLFDLSYDDISDANLRETYVLTMSYLEYVGGGRARQFQAIFSFCRSMWVTLFFYSIPYILIGTRPSTEDLSPRFEQWISPVAKYDPLVLEHLGGETGMLIIGVTMLATVVLFMEGERQYKSLFVDYFMADFLTSTNKNLREV